MTEDVDVVIAEPLERATLPEWLQGGVALVLHLVKSGVWAEVARRLRVQREGGYVGIDAVLFLLLFFGSGARSSIKGFAARAGLHGELLAALGGRKSLPTQSAMSRLLEAMDGEEVRGLGPWLLSEATGAASVMGHPVMQTCDARGKGWHVFDYDPTKTVLRQRSLPSAEDMPAPRRRTDGFAAPGYPGHKRGEVQVSRAVLQHAGSALWLDMRINPGNGDGLESVASALRVIADLTARLRHPRSRTLLRLDGEFGNVPALTAFKEAGQPALTRLNRPGLFDQPEVWQRIVSGTWYRVPDSGAGPTRSALDLGMVLLRPGRDTRRADGSRYEPIEVRVVVSRYPRQGDAEHGRVIDGWQYELFVALDMPADAWPAHEVVAAYFGRGGQENRFAQEDRELGLDRIFSYHLAGQELACLVGLMVWNLQIVHGFHLEPPPARRKPAPRRAPTVDDRQVPARFEPAEAVGEPEAVAEPAPVESVEAHFESLTDALGKLDWGHLLRKRNDWAWNPTQGALYCPAGTPMTLTNVTVHPQGKASKLVFRAPLKACGACPLRASCLSSARGDAVKLITFSVPNETGEWLASLLEPVHRARRLARSIETLAVPPPSGNPRRPPTGAPLAVKLATNTSPPAGRRVAPALFLPAAARQAFRKATAGVAIRVEVRKPIVAPPHPYVATSTARRQRRRATWAERLGWYALPSGTSVRTTLHAGTTLAATFPWAAGAASTRQGVASGAGDGK